MKKTLCILTSFFSALNAFSQDNYVTIKGIAYTTAFFRKNDTIPVKDAEVRLRVKDSIHRQLTTSDGKFSFTISRAVFNATLDISTTNQSSSKEKYLCKFYPSREIEIIDLEKSTVIINKNLRLNANELSHCIPSFATFFFSKNSVIPSVAITNDTIPIDTAIKNLIELLTDFPKMKVEINGHADSDESDKLGLSNKRASYLADKLISMSIKKERLVIKCHSAKEPFPIIEKVYVDGSAFSYTTDREKLAQRNPRVTYRIITWGFDDVMGED